MRAKQISITVQRKKTGLHLFTFGIVLLTVAILLPLKLSHKQENVEVTTPVEAKPAQPEPLLIEYKETLRWGETMAELLSNYGFSPADIYALHKQTKPVYDLAMVKAGRQVRLFAAPEAQIVRLEYDVDDVTYLAVERNEDSFVAELREFPIKASIDMIWGIIEESPITAFNKLNEGDPLALAFADLFAWDVDFYIDLRRGDTFKVIFEKRYLKGEFIGYGDILAAELNNQGKTIQAFLYTYPDTQKSDYFDAEGNSVRKEFLKSPIKWARITSRFSHNRLHPVHKVYRAHYGVDYAAPVGTPVQATADGIVTLAGWNGGAGRMVRIRHANAYETLYLHLRNFGPGIKKGARVKGGDIVGYVGSSGESTGPHLDYRIKLRGSYINPLGWRFKPAEPLRNEYKDAFRQEIEKYRFLFEDPTIISGGFF